MNNLEHSDLVDVEKTELADSALAFGVEESIKEADQDGERTDDETESIEKAVEAIGLIGRAKKTLPPKRTSDDGTTSRGVKKQPVPSE